MKKESILKEDENGIFYTDIITDSVGNVAFPAYFGQEAKDFAESLENFKLGANMIAAMSFASTITHTVNDMEMMGLEIDQDKILPENFNLHMTEEEFINHIANNC